MPRNVRIHDARLTLVMAACLVITFAFMVLPSSAARADEDLAGEKYRQKQREMVQAVRDIRTNLLTEEVVNEFKRVERQFNGVIASGTKERGPGFKVLQAGLRYRVYSAADPARQTAVGMETVLKNLDRNLHSAGQAINDRQEKQRFRTLVCRETLSLLRELLDNDFDARSFAIGILPELETSTSRDRRLEIHDDVDEVLTEILADPDQPDAVKVRAAQSITLYLEKYDPGTQVEMSFARAVRAQLSNPNTDVAYQYFLLNALARIRAGREAVGTPRRATVIETLSAVLQDQRRQMLVRCRAAGALGEVGYDQQIRFEPIAWKVAQLGVEAAVQYNASPNDPDWAECGERLFLAFHHEDRDRRDGPNPQGFLNRIPESELVRGAYAQLLPIAAKMTFGQNVPEKAIVSAHRWVKENTPDDLKFGPYADPLMP